MISMFKVRGAKAINCNFDHRILNAAEITSRCINNAMNTIIANAQPDENGVTIDKVKGRYLVKSDGTEITPAVFQSLGNNWSSIFGSIPSKGNKGKARGVVEYAIERIKSYCQRNNKKVYEISAPRVHNDKSLYVKDNGVTLLPEENTLRLKTFFGEEIDIKYDPNISQNMLELYEHRSNIVKNGAVTVGGSFHLGQKTFGTQIDIVEDPLYQPVGFLGFDVNLADGCWLVFNMPSRLSIYEDRPEHIYKLTSEIKRLNRKLNLKNKPISERVLLNEDGTYRPYRTDERRKDRLEWKRLHKKLKREIRNIAQDIINFCIENKLCLCIDNVATGERNGTFGQDHLIEWLKTLCENQRVPFYSIPTYYTSQKCSKCGHTHKKNRKGDEFKCLSCGHEDSSHHNASVNIANKGKELHDQGHLFCRYETRNKKVRDIINKMKSEA